jgi:hypothetical protein
VEGVIGRVALSVSNVSVSRRGKVSSQNSWPTSPSYLDLGVSISTIYLALREVLQQ